VNVVFAYLSEGHMLSTEQYTSDEVTIIEIDYDEAKDNAEAVVKYVARLRRLAIQASGEHEDKHLLEKIESLIDELLGYHDS